MPTPNDDLMMTELYSELTSRGPTARLNDVLDASTDGIMLLEAIRDANNEITDFRFIHCNKAAFRLGKFPPSTLGKTLLQILPHLQRSEQLELHKKVVETGVPVRMETSFRNEKGEEYGWFIVGLTKTGDNVVSTFTDISEKRKNEEKIGDQSELLHSIFEASINAIFAAEAIRNGDGEITDLQVVKINSAFTGMLGITTEEAEKLTYLQLFPRAEEFGFFQLYCNVIETGLSSRKELYYNDGRVTGWFDVSPVKRGNNGIVITFNNITEVKRDKERLEEAAKKLSTVINNSHAGMFTLIPVYGSTGEIEDFRFGIVNQSVATYIGGTTEKLTGSLASTFFPSYKTNGLFDVYKDTFLTSKQHQFDFHHDDGYDGFFDIHTVKAGHEVLVTFTDHTSLKRLQLQLEASVDELRNSNASLEEFAYAASHDLQEPLRKIHYFSERLKKELGDRFSGEESRMFERIESASKRMSQLINDLLIYSQMTRKNRAFARVDLSQVIQQVVSDLETAVTEKKASITVAQMPEIFGDTVQLTQMFQNLLSNSIKYSRDNVRPDIKIAAGIVSKTNNGTNKTFHEISIRDNGIGFDQEHSERIFKIFQRLHGQSEYPGTGIGLAIVHKVVENHNGIIKAEARSGEGATFTILLPFVD